MALKNEYLNALRMDLSKEPIVDDDPSITQKKQSKNRRHGTLIHNLTSSNTRTRHSTARQINVDIRDPIYKLPFEHGWKRELVYRKLGQSNRNGDVYYYSPTNQKLRSFREIQEQLDLLSDNDLTTKSFTFLTQPIGINDQSKERVRDPYSTLSKEKSFVGVAVGPKKYKIPVQQLPFNYKLSDDENNKSSSTMKTVLKNDKRSSRLRSKNDPNDAKDNSGNKRQKKYKFRSYASESFELQVPPTPALKMDLSKEPIEVNDPSITQKKQSKAKISSPETIDVKENSGNKGQKKYNLRSNAKESLELQVPTTSAHGTLIHNLTSSNTRTRHSTARQINVDIRDPIYKLPFEHGWKRELVYRKLGQSNKNGDVYYYSPTNQKLRSFREIQEQLDLLSDNDLTTESFTFLTQPIGINDQSKERVRDAYSTLSKEKSFVGVAVGPKKYKIPVQQLPFNYKLSDDENNRSSSTMKTVLKNDKRSSRLRSKNDPNDAKGNPGNKRQKKYNLRSNAKESFELQVPPTSDFLYDKVDIFLTI